LRAPQLEPRARLVSRQPGRDEMRPAELLGQWSVKEVGRSSFRLRPSSLPKVLGGQMQREDQIAKRTHRQDVRVAPPPRARRENDKTNPPAGTCGLHRLLERDARTTKRTHRQVSPGCATSLAAPRKLRNEPAGRYVRVTPPPGARRADCETNPPAGMRRLHRRLGDARTKKRTHRQGCAGCTASLAAPRKLRNEPTGRDVPVAPPPRARRENYETTPPAGMRGLHRLLDRAAKTTKRTHRQGCAGYTASWSATRRLRNEPTGRDLPVAPPPWPRRENYETNPPAGICRLRRRHDRVEKTTKRTHRQGSAGCAAAMTAKRKLRNEPTGRDVPVAPPPGARRADYETNPPAGMRGLRRLLDRNVRFAKGSHWQSAETQFAPFGASRAEKKKAGVHAGDPSR